MGVWECVNALDVSMSAVKGSAVAGSPSSGAMTVASRRYQYVYESVKQVS